MRDKFPRPYLREGKKKLASLQNCPSKMGESSGADRGTKATFAGDERNMEQKFTAPTKKSLSNNKLVDGQKVGRRCGKTP